MRQFNEIGIKAPSFLLLHKSEKTCSEQCMLTRNTRHSSRKPFERYFQLNSCTCNDGVLSRFLGRLAPPCVRLRVNQCDYRL
eukprot:5428102-Pyramimonas_sp.AAC.1